MNQPSRRPAPQPEESAEAPGPAETAVPAETPRSDEELLDESLAETFPASDPISPGGTSTPPLPPYPPSPPPGPAQQPPGKA